MKKILISASAAIIVALISYAGVRYTIDHHHSDPAATQKDTTGPSAKVFGIGNKTVTSSGSTVVSFDQKGGVTAMNYYNVKIILQSPNAASATAKGFNYSLDTAKKIIHFSPKTGQWDTPCVAIPVAEKEAVQPYFGSESNTPIAVGHNTIPLDGDTVYSQSTASSPATAHSGYLLHYVQLPTVFFFGDKHGPIYKAILKAP